ncbi:MAG: hypothetical protein RR704_07395 [Stenotrophomonas sp.]
MTRPTPWLALALLCGVASSCSAAPAQTLQQHCAATPIDDRVEIKVTEQGLLSACPPDADEDCIYSLTVGQTFAAGTPDLNADGQPDQLVKHLGSSQGDVDAVHYLGFVQCGDGTAIKVLEGQFKEVIVPTRIPSAWPPLTATRGCAVPGHEDAPLQQIKLTFDPGTYRYVESPKQAPESACGELR